MSSIEIKSHVDLSTATKISPIKVMVCLLLSFLASVYPTFFFFFLFCPSRPPILKSFVSTFLTTYMLDAEIIISENFLSSKIFKFSV